jgi:anti-sigma regulatory factor (Ser/Thr protein kinase)
MNIRVIIKKGLDKNGQVTSKGLVGATGLSRSYVARILKDMVDSGKLHLIGKANQAHYVPVNAGIKLNKSYDNGEVSEDTALNAIKAKNPKVFELKKNVADIVDYAFLEMFNNAIDHSKSKKIAVKLSRNPKSFSFQIVDNGIGIFSNLADKFKLKGELEAIGHLMKGKQTTMPDRHSGEGIFFTSKMADRFVIESGTKRLIIDNRVEDMFVEDIEKIKGTRVRFEIDVDSNHDINKVFSDYSDSDYAFDKTQITVELFKMGESFLSRSQARRMMQGLDKFKIIVLDFKKVGLIGQAFADEVFRVWQNANPEVNLAYINASDNAEFMIKRAILREE